MRRTRSGSSPPSDEDCCCCLLFLLILSSMLGACLWDLHNSVDPSVVVESLTVSSHPADNATATWRIGVSIRNVNMKSRLEFRDLNVWVKYVLESSSQAGISPFELGPGARVSADLVVKSSLTDHARDQLVHGSVVDVFLRGECTHPYLGPLTVKAACRDVGVGFLSGATRGRKYCTVEEGFDSSYRRHRDSYGCPV